MSAPSRGLIQESFISNYGMLAAYARATVYWIFMWALRAI